MQALQNNLEGKSKQYKDPALTHLFLMNNIHYMVRSVRRSEAKDLLGDDWVQRHRRVVEQHANLYKRTAWTKVKMFNMQFDELHQRQSQWTVPDTELRESLRLAVAEVLLPAYRSFLKRFGPLVESGKNSQRYIMYKESLRTNHTVEKRQQPKLIVDECVNELFLFCITFTF
ncbi:hypothetical protein YC2023_120911 [Brassica napus]